MNGNTSEPPVCVVTGGTSGIGNATAKLFASHGYRIATCGRNVESIAQVQRDLSPRTGHWVSQVELSDIKQTQTFATKTIERFGQVDVLVNNAAAAPLAPFTEIDSTTFESLVDTNLRSSFYLTQTVWRKMLEQGRGVVINISSLAAVDPFPGFSIYGASKAWLDLLTTALASEGEPNGIRTYSVRAGAVETPLLRGLFPDFPADQCVSPEQVADKIWQLVSEPGDVQSGEHIVVANQS